VGFTDQPVFARNEAAYYGIIVTVLTAVLVEMATAFGLPRSFAVVLHCVTIHLPLFVSALGGIELTWKV
jgi:hypothetical protein